MKSVNVPRLAGILVGSCLLVGGCRSVDSTPSQSRKTGFYTPPQRNAKQAKEAKPSWLDSWFGTEEPGPAKSIDEFMSLERPG